MVPRIIFFCYYVKRLTDLFELEVYCWFVCLFILCRWREDQRRQRADHVASAIQSRPASVDVLAKKVTDEHGKSYKSHSSMEIMEQCRLFFEVELPFCGTTETC